VKNRFEARFARITAITTRPVYILSLEQDSPDPREVQSIGKVVALPQVGGLHHRYERRVA